MSAVDNDNDTGEFLDLVNSTPRKLGHNKLQMEIESLNKDIEAWKLVDSQKQVKLDLFKKTISNLQTQLQEKAVQVNQLQLLLDNNPDSTQVQNLSQLLSEKDHQINELNLTVDNIRGKLESCTLQLDTFQKTTQDKTETVNSQTSEIDTLKITIEKQVRNINQLESEQLLLNQELQMKSNLVNNSQTELESLRQELAVYKLKVDEQVQQIIETENELQTQLEYSQPQEIPEDTTPRVIGTNKKKNTRGEQKKRR